LLLAGPVAAADESCATRLTAAVEELLELRTDEPWGFVLAVHPPSGDFVQFGLAEGALFIELPVDSLSSDELERAHEVFREAGMPETVRVETLLPGGEAGHTPAFQAGLDGSAEAGRLGCRVLREVHRVPDDAELSITSELWPDLEPG
jgi:hypothetical protein